MSDKMSNKEFCDLLRAQAVRLAGGESEKIQISDFDLQQALAEYHKINASYIRTIMNRVPEVKEIGSVKVKRVKDDPEMPDCFIVTIGEVKNRRVITGDELPAIKKRANKKFAEKILSVMPNVMHLEGGMQAGALEGIKLYQEMIAKMIEEDE